MSWRIWRAPLLSWNSEQCSSPYGLRVQDMISDSTDAQFAPPPETANSKIRKALGPIVVIGVVILKFLAKIKCILPILLKSGGSMLVTIFVYAMVWGWQFAVAFVLLIML